MVFHFGGSSSTVYRFLCDVSLFSLSCSLWLSYSAVVFSSMCLYTMVLLVQRNNMLMPRASYQHWEDKALSSSIARVLLFLSLCVCFDRSGDVRSLLLSLSSSTSSTVWPCEGTTTTSISVGSQYMQFQVHAFPSLTHFLAVVVAIVRQSIVSNRCGHYRLLMRALLLYVCFILSASISFSGFSHLFLLLYNSLTHSLSFLTCVCMCESVCAVVIYELQSHWFCLFSLLWLYSI